MHKRLFSELGISKEVLSAIDKLGFEEASPIQSQAIPILLTGHDVVGQSQTGSGKTAAFAIPAIETIDPTNRQTQVLVLCPTRELTVQVAEEVHKLSQFKEGLRVLPIYGGQSYDRQIRGLKQGAAMIIGTPGRVLDHLRRKTLSLKALKIIILDEADEMLDMGFRDDLDAILEVTPETRQMVFFSATLARPIQDLIRKHARDPHFIQIEHKTLTVPTVEQSFYEVPRQGKLEALTRLIDLNDFKLAIIFCNTKRQVDELTDDLIARGFLADRLHGDINQNMRERVMNKFRNLGIEFLVATDVAARGIDVENIEVVFNYDLPKDEEDYVHRIGRTGRVGRAGLAISLVAGGEIYLLQRIERFIKTKIRRQRLPTLDELEAKKTEQYLEKLRGILNKGEYQRHDALLDELLEEGFSSTDIAAALLAQFIGIDSRPREDILAVYSDAKLGHSSDKSASSKKKFSANQLPVIKTHTNKNSAKPSNRFQENQTQGDMQRIFVNAGSTMNIGPGDVVGALIGEAGIPKSAIGIIDIDKKFLFVEIAKPQLEMALEALNRMRIKGRKINAEIAGERGQVSRSIKKSGKAKLNPVNLR